jgi:hypothetical protein
MDGSAFSKLGDALVTLFVVACTAVIGCIVLLIYVIWSLALAPDWQREAIQRGYALYCPGDGSFAWVGECIERE